MMILRALTSAGDSATIADRKSKSDGLMMEAESGCRNNLSHKNIRTPTFRRGSYHSLLSLIYEIAAKI